MAGWESGPGKAFTTLENNDVNFQNRNFSSPHLQTSASPGALQAAARASAPGNRETEAGRRGARSSGLGARPEEGTQDSRALAAAQPPLRRPPRPGPPRPARDKARSPRREGAGRLPRAPRSPVGARLRPAAPREGARPRPNG